MGKSSAARSMFQPVLNCDCASPSPPAAVADDEAREADQRMLRTPGLHQLVECRLAHCVRAEPRPRRCERRADRRQVHRGAGRLRELADRGARDDRGSGDVGVEYPAPGARIGVGEPGQRADPRGVHERIDPAELRRRVGDRRPAGIFVGDVALDRERRRPGFLRGVFEVLAPPGEQRNVRASLGEADPDATPEPARCTYHYGSQLAPLSVWSTGTGGDRRQAPRPRRQNSQVSSAVSRCFGFSMRRLPYQLHITVCCMIAAARRVSPT